MKCDIFLFCGEPSGDLHGEALIQSLLEQNSDAALCGVGGPRMRRLPFRCILPMEEFQVMGFIDVFKALPRLVRHFYSLADFILKIQPKTVLLIDYPGFNLRLARHLRKKGFSGKIVQYICPSVWAHGKGRIQLIEKHFDALLSIFPFEKSLFSKTFPVHYVGHPLASRIASSSTNRLTWLEPGQTLIALFPGSRKKEIILNFPLQLKALKSVLSPSIIGAVSVSQKAFLPLLEECLKKEGLENSPWIRFVPSEDTYRLMKTATCALAKSGTVTLELALHEVPTVVTYGIAPLDLFIAQRILRISLPFYCIVNIIAQKEVFPELIGPALTEEALSEQLNQLLSPFGLQKKKESLQEIAHILGKKKASRESARLLLLR